MHEEEAFVVVVAILASMAIAVVAIRQGAWIIKSWIDSALKRDMVARGYTAQEILAVVGSDRRCRSWPQWSDAPPAKPIRQPAYTHASS